MKYTPETITKLEPGQIFVFGSNTAGIHGKGAAYMAHKKFGYPWGLGEGLNAPATCYAIPTKKTPYITLSLIQIAEKVNTFITVAQENLQLQFLVTPIGCGLAGYAASDIAPMFSQCIYMENIILPKNFLEALNV
jgi:hypothetical protein